MSRLKSLLALALTLAPLVIRADPADDLRAAITTLARTSYTWEVTARQRFKGETTDPRLDTAAAPEVQGKFDPHGYSQITLLPSRTIPATVTAVFRLGDVVALTPNGWLPRSELRSVQGGDREVTVDGKKVRLSRVYSAALKATAMQPLAEELFNVIAEAKSWRRVQDVVIAELRDRAIEELWGEPDAKRAPEVHGTMLFKLGERGLTEYHVVLGIGFPNSRTKKVAWTMQQWTTRITNIGSTQVDPPSAAVQALEK